jgi:ABC-2 type transport system permease protein
MSNTAAVAAWPRLQNIQSTARFYWEVARRGYARFATYRGATIAGVFTNTIFGFMRAYVLIALFTSRPHVGGYTVDDALTYTWLTQGALMVIYIWGWYEIAERIRSGDIIADLQRPIDFQFYWLSQDLGRALYHAIYRGIPPFILGALAFHLVFPDSPGTYALFLVSLFLAVCLSYSLRFIINVLAFWMMDYRGINGLAAVFWTVLSGFVIPLAVFPPVWRTVALLLPFAGMIQTPIDVYLQKTQGMTLLGALGLQVFWTVVLLAFGRWLLARGVRDLVVQGG